MKDFYKELIVKTIEKSHFGVISNPGIPGEKSLNLKQISPPADWRVEMTVADIVIASLCPKFFWVHSQQDVPLLLTAFIYTQTDN